MEPYKFVTSNSLDDKAVGHRSGYAYGYDQDHEGQYQKELEDYEKYDRIYTAYLELANILQEKQDITGIASTMVIK